MENCCDEMEVVVVVAAGAAAAVVEQEVTPTFLVLMKMKHSMQFPHVLHQFHLPHQFLLLLENETYGVTTWELSMMSVSVLLLLSVLLEVDIRIPAAYVTASSHIPTTTDTWSPLKARRR